MNGMRMRTNRSAQVVATENAWRHALRVGRTALRHTIMMVSSAAAVCSVILCTTSFSRAEYVRYWGAGRLHVIHSARGIVAIEVYTGVGSRPRGFSHLRHEPSEPIQFARGAPILQHVGIGFAYRDFRDRRRQHFQQFYGVCVPYWLLFAGFSIMPLLYLRRCRQHRWESLPGHCHGCGYDLRATPNRCPECGRVPVTPVRAEGTTDPTAVEPVVPQVR
jgi:hypothetical protein